MMSAEPISRAPVRKSHQPTRSVRLSHWPPSVPCATVRTMMRPDSPSPPAVDESAKLVRSNKRKLVARMRLSTLKPSAWRAPQCTTAFGG